MSRRHHTRAVTSIIYNVTISCLVRVFLVTNVSMIIRHTEESGRMNGLVQAVPDYHAVIVLVYMIFGLALFAVASMILQKPYIRYISRISDAVQSISEGNSDTTIDAIGDDESSSMAANLNKMVEDIKGLMDKGRGSKGTKNELTTNVVRDLRTLLASIIGYLELLAGNTRIPAGTQHEYIETAYGRARRLEKLIEDLLGFTKLNYGKVSMHVAQLGVVKLLGQLLEEAYPNFVEKNLSYDLQNNVLVRIITVDGNLPVRSFDDLIGNAARYGADGKRVLVKLYADDELVTVSVTNYGYVIPPDELPLMSNKFYRVEQSRPSTTGGTGLGFATTREIVDIHGGTTQVVSDLNRTMFIMKLQVHFDINKEDFGTVS